LNGLPFIIIIVIIILTYLCIWVVKVPSLARLKRARAPLFPWAILLFLSVPDKTPTRHSQPRDHPNCGPLLALVISLPERKILTWNIQPSPAAVTMAATPDLNAILAALGKCMYLQTHMIALLTV
jgi:hypothetical protein